MFRFTEEHFSFALGTLRAIIHIENIRVRLYIIIIVDCDTIRPRLSFMRSSTLSVIIVLASTRSLPRSTYYWILIIFIGQMGLFIFVFEAPPVRTNFLRRQLTMSDTTQRTQLRTSGPHRVVASTTLVHVRGICYSCVPYPRRSRHWRNDTASARMC